MILPVQLYFFLDVHPYGSSQSLGPVPKKQNHVTHCLYLNQIQVNVTHQYILVFNI